MGDAGRDGLRRVLADGPVRLFGRRTFLTEAGAPAASVYLVQTGYVRVFLLRPSGQETTTAVLGPGHLVGIGALVGRPTYSAFTEALTTVRAQVFEPRDLLARLADDELLQDLIEKVGRRLGLVQALLYDTTLLQVADRVPDTLAHLDACLGGSHPRLKRNLLASLVAARPETVTRSGMARRLAWTAREAG